MDCGTVKLKILRMVKSKIVGVSTLSIFVENPSSRCLKKPFVFHIPIMFSVFLCLHLELQKYMVRDFEAVYASLASLLFLR